MSLFYINNAGPEPLKPLSRKFRVREISPAEELSGTQGTHSKEQSDFSNVLTKKTQNTPNTQTKNQEQSQQQAAQAYRETQADSQVDFGKVSDIMSNPVLTIQKSQTLGEAWRLMQKYEIHHLPVLDTEAVLCGMLSEKLIVPFMMSDAFNSQTWAQREHIPLETFCTQPIISTTPDTLVKDLVPALLEHDLDGVVVTENGFLSGIITYPDILKIVIRMQAFTTNV